MVELQLSSIATDCFGSSYADCMTQTPGTIAAGGRGTQCGQLRALNRAIRRAFERRLLPNKRTYTYRLGSPHRWTNRHR